MDASIFQDIWDADRDFAGVTAVLAGTPVTAALKAGGYVVVDPSATGNQSLLPEAHIPDAKRRAYDLTAVLFDKYVLDQTKPDPNTPDEQAEVNELIEFAYRSPPMALARAYVEGKFSSPMTDDEWWGYVQRIWFEKFRMGQNPSLSGFEHVFLGEQKSATLNGYHFWYKYYLDETHELDGVPDDLITIVGTDEQPHTPDVVTLKFRLMAFSYAAKKKIPLFKPVGGFWVGPSPAGLLALGAAAFAHGGQVVPATIHGVRYKVNVFKDGDGRYLRTCYPEFVGRDGPA